MSKCPHCPQVKECPDLRAAEVRLDEKARKLEEARAELRTQLKVNDRLKFDLERARSRIRELDPSADKRRRK